jgi:hypothetical protein
VWQRPSFWVKDLWKEDGSFLKLEDFKLKYKFYVPFLELFSCINCVKQYMKNKGITIVDNKYTKNPLAFDTILK